MASAASSFSFGSLSQLIAISSIKLKPYNYLIWRTQILQVMQTMKVSYLATDDPSKNDSDQDKKAYQEWEDKDLVLRS